MSIIHLNIGSNVGPGRELIAGACTRLARSLGPCRLELSDYFESDPWGYAGARRYVNRGVRVITAAAVAPADVLAATQSVEQSLGGATPHRNPDGSYRDRLLDIDIIDIEGVVCDTPALTLPHPRMHLRTFVLEPLAELAPGWRHPLLGRTAAELLSEIDGQ